AFVTRRADRVVAVSEHIARLLRRLPNVDKEEITVIPNGISFPGTVIEPGSKGGPLAVACVCRLEPWKRPRLLLEAVALLNEDCSIAVSMIGSGPLEREMKALAIDLGIEDRVKVLGYRDDVSDLLAGADVLVHTARNEPFGLVILEAASVGALPIVMQDGGGALEALPPDGEVVRDASHLATTLADLAGSSALSTEARRARADWVRAHFNVDRCARRYAVVYEEAVTARMADVQS
ncbi:MAG: glycosyltransferase, partial [Actinomycetota bacterium]